MKKKNKPQNLSSYKLKHQKAFTNQTTKQDWKQNRWVDRINRSDPLTCHPEVDIEGVDGLSIHAVPEVNTATTGWHRGEGLADEPSLVTHHSWSRCLDVQVLPWAQRWKERKLSINLENSSGCINLQIHRTWFPPPPPPPPSWLCGTTDTDRL